MATSSTAALEDAIRLLGTQIMGLPNAIAIAQVQVQGPATGNAVVPAFDRPSPVIIMGPKPLPVTGMTGEKAKEPKEPKEPKDKPGALSQGFSAVLGRFAAVLGPLALFGAMASSATSGLQTLTKSVQLFASTLTPVLLPATVLLSTALVSLAEVITSGTGAGMEAFFGIILSLGIPAIVVLVESAMKLAKLFDDIAESETVKRLRGKSEDPETDMGLRTFLKVGPFAPLRMFDSEEERTGAKEARERAEDGQTPAEKIVMGALKDVMASLKMSIGPKASISSIEGIGKQVQLAALNQDPIEGRQLRAQEQILRILERAVNRMGRERAVYGPGAGDYDDERGSIRMSDGSADYGGTG